MLPRVKLAAGSAFGVVRLRNGRCDCRRWLPCQPKGPVLNDKSSRARLVVLEPSKVGPQHITFIEAYLLALSAIDVDAMGIDLIYAADPTSHAALAATTRTRITWRPVSVINAEDRRWVAKGLLEVWTVMRAAWQLGPRDMLLITCLTTPALLILEIISFSFGNNRVMVVLHSELEALVNDELRSPRTWGFWSHHWSQFRRPGSRIRIAVIADYVRDALTATGIAAVARSEVELLTFPVGPSDDLPFGKGVHRVAFIGYKTWMKGFDRFEALANSGAAPNCQFNIIGAGRVENIITGASRPFDESGFLGEVAQSTLAILPYSQGYVATVSAAVLDALSTGVHIVATRRGCFEAIHREFGDDTITLYDTPEQLAALVADDAFLDRMRGGAAARRARLPASSFGTAATEADFRRLLANWGFAA